MDQSWICRQAPPSSRPKPTPREFRDSIRRLISNMARAEGGEESTGTKGIAWACARPDMRGIWEKYQTILQQKPSLPHATNSVHPLNKIIRWSSVSAGFRGPCDSSCPVLFISKQMEICKLRQHSGQKAVKLCGISGGQVMLSTLDQAIAAN